jgi:hypothetical protein
MSALPSRFYGNPMDCADEMRKITQAGKRQAERDRLHKGRRIRALVKGLMNGKSKGDRR